MEAIISFFIGVVAGILCMCICKSGANGSAGDGTGSDTDRARELERRAESDIERAKRSVEDARDHNSRLTEGCGRAADLIKRGKEILNEANNNSRVD